MLNKDVLLAIGAGKHQLALIKRAKKMGYHVIAVDINPNAQGFAFSDEAIIESAHEPEKVWHVVQNHPLKEKICSVLTQAARHSVYTTAVISKKLGKVGVDPNVALSFLNKQHCSDKFNPKRAQHLQSYLKKEQRKFPFPIVIKKEGYSGGTGNRVIYSENELSQFRPSTHHLDSILVEPLVEGRHFGIVGLLTDNGLKTYAIIEKEVHPNLTFKAYRISTNLQENIRKKLINFALDIIKQSKLNFGPFQLECILDNEGKIHFIELETSLIGSYISEWMIPESTGHCIITDSINATRGILPKAETLAPLYTTEVKPLYAANEGQLIEMKAHLAHRLVMIYPYFNVGEQITDKKIPVAHALVVAKTEKQTAQALKNIKVNFKVKQ